MPGRQRRQLTFRLEYLLRRFPALWNGPNASPLRRYVRDLPDEVASDGETKATFRLDSPRGRADLVLELDPEIGCLAAVSLVPARVVSGDVD